jgi:hypothetical protein
METEEATYVGHQLAVSSNLYGKYIYIYGTIWDTYRTCMALEARKDRKNIKNTALESS